MCAGEPFDVRIVLTEARNGIDVSKPGDFVAVFERDIC